jgi:diadenosine tetraphosphate (Ap4A) HIT family hydrolase
MSNLPTPPKGAIIYEDERVYVCLASCPITEGHTVVVWKEKTEDITDLSCRAYDYLLDIVDITREALIKAVGVEKVYLAYLDETNEVHWHLVPRYNERGFEVFLHKGDELKDFSLVKKIQPVFQEVLKKHSSDF